jgi:hypothetical protein
MVDAVGHWSRLEHALENGVPLSSFLIAEYVIDRPKRDR